ncbi:Zinc finger, RING/FYVE/PHD-type domain containing protein [Trema orientale]|uniref:Zinc finger, RING/FYVE/PHD-type domain containing protein n=1 Tax=Trema orientale TaxID=63057 RepID=A0A2P5F3C9_TREOI|nr:Zinc finger, RING/FYVE/PHD-type domain containing protein [Trema orientale]
MHSDRESRRLQVIVQFPDLQIPSKTLILTPSESQTLHHLKRSLFAEPFSSEALSSFYFTLNGKPLDDSSPILSSRIAPLSTLILRSRARGGGGDGGATGAESRDCYLNMYAEKKPDKVDPNEQRLSKWLNCALSNEPLKEPCVVDWLGNVFNKEALVEALLGKKIPKAFGHIKGLKDMIKIELSSIPGTEGDGDLRSGARFQCPITGLEFNGKYKFFALKNCGHVLSAKALKEVKSSSCLVCHAEFTETDKIVINGNDEEVLVLRERMEAEKGKLREKRAKKVKNGDVAAAANGEVGVGSGSDSARLSGTKHGISDVKAELKVSSNGNGKAVKAASNGAVSAKSLSNNAAAKRFKATDIAPPNANKEVYASIFTSSRKSDFKETYSCRSLPLGRN